MLTRPKIMIVVAFVSLIGFGPTARATVGSNSTWTKYYSGSHSTIAANVLPADDGGYFIVGVTNLDFNTGIPAGDVYLFRTDADGNVLWGKTYGGSGQDAGGSVIPMSDGNLLIVGYTTSFGDGDMDAYLIKVDQEGNELWSRTYGGPLDEMVGGAAQTADGGYLVGGNIVDPDDLIADPGAAGYAGFAGRSNLVLFKIDADGNELWSHTYASDDNILASSGIPTLDGGLLALATVMYYPADDDDLQLIKFDGDGNILWTRTWDENILSGQAIISTADGNYLISAGYSTLDRSKDDFLFIKVDPDGNELWQSTFGDPDVVDYGAEVAETADGGFVVVGERVRDLYTWDTEIMLVKIDENGQFLWEQTKTGSHTMFANVFEHPDEGYVIAGSTFRGSVFDIFLTKTDAEGHLE